MDTRSFVDCAYFLRGACNRGSLCPFRHDPTKVGSVNLREQQGQQDCFYFLQGRCAKGSLCPFRHDESKLPPHLRPAAAAAGGGVPAAQPQQPASITVDFGSPDSQQQPQQRQAQPAAAPAPPRAAPAAAATAPKVVAVRPAPAAAPPARAAPKPAPAAGARATEAVAPAARGGSGGLPSRLAGRLGPPVAAAADEQPDTRRLAAKRPERESEASVGGSRAPRRRAGGALGFVVSALHDALGADAPVETAVVARVRSVHAMLAASLPCLGALQLPARFVSATCQQPSSALADAGLQRRGLTAAQAPAGQRL
jgi:hypothetical protein